MFKKLLHNILWICSIPLGVVFWLIARTLCLVGSHSYMEFKTSVFSKEHGKWVLTSFRQECSICNKKRKHI